MLAEVHDWMIGTVAMRHPVLERVVCPFVPTALERETLVYSAISGCRTPADVMAVMDELIERFLDYAPAGEGASRHKTVVGVFVDLSREDGERLVIASHHELKGRCASQGLMIGEFAPGYQLPSTRDPTVNVGEAPAPILALRHMLLSDRRFLTAEDRWMAAWAAHFGADRVPLFRDLTEAELATVARISREVSTPAGGVLCRQGEAGDQLFLVVEGRAVVHRNNRQIGNLYPGDYFGELAVLTRQPRIATVTATTEMTLYVIERRRFREVIEAVPALTHKLLAAVATRLVDAEARADQV